MDITMAIFFGQGGNNHHFRFQTALGQHAVLRPARFHQSRIIGKPSDKIIIAGR